MNLRHGRVRGAFLAYGCVWLRVCSDKEGVACTEAQEAIGVDIRAVVGGINPFTSHNKQFTSWEDVVVKLGCNVSNGCGGFQVAQIFAVHFEVVRGIVRYVRGNQVVFGLAERKNYHHNVVVTVGGERRKKRGRGKEGQERAWDQEGEGRG